MFSYVTQRLSSLAILTFLAVLVLGPASAGAEVGETAGCGSVFHFPTINGPADAEDVCWEVELDDEQELRAVDDQQVDVVYSDGHRGLTIRAQPAHDAEGTAVPTSIAVTGTNTILFTVHHQAGNLLAGGAPFHYPVTRGVGWEGGFHTVIIEMPPGDREVVPPAPPCVVPDLRGWKLKASRRWLRQAQCGLGKVRGSRRPGAKVVKQSPAPGTVVAGGARVAVKLG